MIINKAQRVVLRQEIEYHKFIIDEDLRFIREKSAEIRKSKILMKLAKDLMEGE